MKHRDKLSVGLLGAILVFWALQMYGLLAIQGEINGALIAAFTLIVQFYFRKKPEDEGVE